MEEKERRFGNQIRKPLNGTDSRPRNEESGYRRNESILRKEREYQEHKKRLQQSVERFQNNVQESIADGRLVVIPRLMQITLVIAEGWTSKLVYIDETKDIFYVKGLKDKPLPIHSHPNIETIHVLSGKMKLIVEDSEVILSAGSSFIISEDVDHKCIPIEDCEMMVTFKPPISEKIGL